MGMVGMESRGVEEVGHLMHQPTVGIVGTVPPAAEYMR
jgi:hypothetical protein